MTTIPDAILVKVEDEVFGGRPGIACVIAEIYAVIKREEALAEKSQALQAHYFCLTCRWHASDVDCCTYAADEIFVDSHGDRFCAECAKQYRGGTTRMERLSSVLSRAAPHLEAGKDDASAEAKFTEYFVRNYPGPDTVIFDPKWHAPKIFRAAVSAIHSAPLVAVASNHTEKAVEE